MDAWSFTHVSPEPRRNPEGELGHERVLRFAHNHLLVSSAWAKRVLSPIPSFQALYRAGVGKSLASLQVLRLRKSAEHGFTQYEPGPATGTQSWLETETPILESLAAFQGIQILRLNSQS